jgi:hypothetical protein
MDSKREVEQSNDEKINQDFPGYPHYPSREDIMDQRTDAHRVDVDVENLPNRNNSGLSQRFIKDSVNNEVRQPGDDDREVPHGAGDNGFREGGLPVQDAANDEIGLPQNVANEDLDKSLPGTDLGEAADRK